MKRKLFEQIAYMNEEQIRSITDLIFLLNRPVSKMDLIGYVYEDTKNIDSVIPLSLQRKMEAIDPNFQRFTHVYDHRNKSLGELRSVSDELIIKLIKTFKV